MELIWKSAFAVGETPNCRPIRASFAWGLQKVQKKDSITLSHEPHLRVNVTSQKVNVVQNLTIFVLATLNFVFVHSKSTSF